MSTTRTTPDLSIVRTEHPNAARLREGFAAFGRGDLDFVRNEMTDDAIWTNSGSSTLAGTYRGWDEIAGMFGKLFELTDGTYSMNLLSCLADDARTAAIYDATSTVAGQTRTMRFVLVEELNPDGKVAETTNVAYDQAAADAHLAGIPQPR